MSEPYTITSDGDTVHVVSLIEACERRMLTTVFIMPSESFSCTTGRSCMAMLLRPDELRYTSDTMRLACTSAVTSSFNDSEGTSSSKLSLNVEAMACTFKLLGLAVHAIATLSYCCPLYMAHGTSIFADITSCLESILPKNLKGFGRLKSVLVK